MAMHLSTYTGRATPAQAGPASLGAELLTNAALVLGATLLLALAARVSLPLPFTPVPVTLGNLAVLLVGLLLGPQRALAALMLYLAEGAAGLPVFSPWGPGGLAQLMGPTGGYLLSYPFAAMLAGAAARKLRCGFNGALLAALAGDVLLLACGASWLASLTHISFEKAVALGVVPFLPGEVLKVAAAAGVDSGVRHLRRA